MTNRHTTFFFNKVEPTIHCGKEIGFVFTGGTYEIPFPVISLPAWKHNLDTCVNCKKNHKNTIRNFNKILKNFPNCCEWHTKLKQVNWFNKSDFEDMPKQYADKLFFSMFHIIHYLDQPTWRKEIFDYLEYVILSFGSFPPNYGSPLYLNDYFSDLKKFLERKHKSETIELTEVIERKREIVDFLVKYCNPVEKIDTDIIVLITTYNQWLKIFPFDISFFQNLKPQYEKQLPIINGKLETNKYSGITKAKMHTKNSLIEVLIRSTNNLLTQINSTTQYKKGLLTEPQKIKLELILNEREMKLKQGYINNSTNEEQRYREILKEWFVDEKRFIDEITPLLKDVQIGQTQTDIEQTVIDNSDEVKIELHNHIFKDNAFVIWERLFENFNINETKRTDLRFMYEIMKYKEQIHKTVTVKNITDWINDTYQFSIEKLQYTDIKNKSNENRMSIYNLIK